MTVYGIHFLEPAVTGDAACAGCERPITNALRTSRVSPVRRVGRIPFGVVSTPAQALGDWWLVKYEIDAVLSGPDADGWLDLAADPTAGLAFSGPYCSRQCAHADVVGVDQHPHCDVPMDSWLFACARAPHVATYSCDRCGWSSGTTELPWVVIAFMPGDSTPMTLVVDGPPDAPDAPRLFCCEECAGQAALDAHLDCLA